MDIKKNIELKTSMKHVKYCRSKLFGIMTLYLLLILQPFHYIINQYVIYYRELISIIFFLLFIQHCFKLKKLRFHQEEIWLFVFIIYMLAMIIVGNDRTIYSQVDITQASKHLNSINPSLYILRNAVIYIPMVIYLSAVGITEKEIRKICIIISICSLASIIMFLKNKGIASQISEVVTIFRSGSSGLSYNSYVPYLTYPLMTALYRSIDSNKKIITAFYFLIYIVLLLYIFATTSRQSIILGLFIPIWYFIFVKREYKIKMLLVLSIIFTIFIIYLCLLKTGLFENYKLYERILSLNDFLNTNRINKIGFGLKGLSFGEYIAGVGLSSVIFGGPHNDYIRWIQRLGIVGMLLSFMPFFIAMFINLKMLIKKNNKPTIIFTSCGLIYVIYHSFFGYPREDAYQSLYAFLSLVLWLNIKKDFMQKQKKAKIYKISNKNMAFCDKKVGIQAIEVSEVNPSDCTK